MRVKSSNTDTESINRFDRCYWHVQEYKIEPYEQKLGATIGLYRKS